MVTKLWILLLALVYVRGDSEADAKTRIVGGKTAPQGVFKWQVSLRIDKGNRHFCGGSIISKKCILTAAHCMVKKSLKDVVAVVGSTVLYAGGDRHKIKAIVIHENYTDTLANDVALLFTEEDIKFSKNVSAVKLDNSTVREGEQLFVSGWGYFNNEKQAYNQLQYLQVTAYSFESCEKAFSRISSSNGIRFREGNLCTYDGKGKGFCQGDSGGPLVRPGRVVKQVGIVSFNLPCARGYPDAYASVAYYYDWIMKHANITSI